LNECVNGHTDTDAPTVASKQVACNGTATQVLRQCNNKTYR